jgi:hypothetical protein
VYGTPANVGIHTTTRGLGMTLDLGIVSVKCQSFLPSRASVTRSWTVAGCSLKGWSCWDSSAVLERIRFMRERISVASPRGRLAWLVAIALVAAMAAPATGHAGGPFEQIVGIGARAQSTQLKLAASGTRSEDSLRGRRTHAPGVGYVRIYTLIGGLPGIPGRYYPMTGVLCLSWNEQPSNCAKLESPGRRLLAPLARLSRLHRPPTLSRTGFHGGSDARIWSLLRGARDGASEEVPR